MENDRNTKINVRECAGSCSVNRPWKRWIATVKIKKINLDVTQARRMVHRKNEWRKFVREIA